MATQHFIRIPTHPLLWCTLSYIFGICHAWGHAPLFFALTAAGIALLTILLFIFCGVITLRSIVGILLLLGSFLAGHFRYSSVLDSYRQLSTQLTQAPFDATAVIIQRETGLKKGFKNCLTLKLRSISREGEYHTLNALVRLYTTNTPDLQVGDSITVSNLLCKPINSHSYEWYLFKEGISASAFIPRLSYEIVHHPSISFSRWRALTRDRIQEAVSKKLSRATHTLFCALFLGTKAPHEKIYQQMRSQCTAWGIVHYLARSGLHVVLIVWTWNFLLRFICLNFFLKQFLLLILIILYHMLTWPSISFMRAFISFILYKICTLNTLSYQTIHILSLTTLFVLLVNPLQLFFLDFQLSFGLTFALAWFNERAVQMRRILARD